MKNIHIIPTDKPSRVFTTKDEGLGFDNQMLENTELDCQNQNIYITSDEEIKEGDWFYDLDTKYVKVKKSWENSHLGFNGKKIILTTDQDLIKDGVQAIDDEFLEWFVKNPSCEEVEVEESYSMSQLSYSGIEYEIIISKEEPKFENSIENTINIISVANSMFGNKEEPKQQCKDCNDNLTDCTCIEDTIDMKQETLEEFAKECLRNNNLPTEGDFAEGYVVGSIFGAKWQQERMYSEEEVYNICNELSSYFIGGDTFDLKDWFEQFKK